MQFEAVRSMPKGRPFYVHYRHLAAFVERLDRFVLEYRTGSFKKTCKKTKTPVHQPFAVVIKPPGRRGKVPLVLVLTNKRLVVVGTVAGQTMARDSILLRDVDGRAVSPRGVYGTVCFGWLPLIPSGPCSDIHSSRLSVRVCDVSASFVVCVYISYSVVAGQTMARDSILLRDVDGRAVSPSGVYGTVCFGWLPLIPSGPCSDIHSSRLSVRVCDVSASFVVCVYISYSVVAGQTMARDSILLRDVDGTAVSPSGVYGAGEEF